MLLGVDPQNSQAEIGDIQTVFSPRATALRSVISMRSQPSGMIFIFEYADSKIANISLYSLKLTEFVLFFH